MSTDKVVGASHMARRIRQSVAVIVYHLGTRLANIRLAGGQSACRRRFAACGPDLDFDPLSSSFDYPKVRIGSRVFIGAGANFSGKVTVGDDVMFANGVHITDGYHRWDVVGKTIRDSGPGKKVRVHVESDVWIGANVTLMKGVTVGEGAIAGTKALILSDVPPYSVAVGSPSRVVSVRFSDAELVEHLLLRGRSAADAEAMVERRRAALIAAGYDGTGL